MKLYSSLSLRIRATVIHWVGKDKLSKISDLLGTMSYNLFHKFVKLHPTAADFGTKPVSSLGTSASAGC